MPYVYTFCYFFFAVLICPGYGCLELGFLPTISILISSVGLGIHTADKSLRYGFSSITFWVFCYVFLGVAPVSQLLSSGLPWFDHYESTDINMAWLISILGMIAYVLGSYKSNSGDLIDEGKLDNNLGFLALFLVFILISFFGVYKSGGFSVLFMSRNDAFQSSSGEDIASVVVFQSAMRIPMFLFSLLLLSNIRKGSSRLLYSLLVLSVVFTVLINNPISTPRYWFGAVLMSYLAFAVKYYRADLVRYFAPAIIFSLLMIFPLSDLFRASLDVDFSREISNFSFTSHLEKSGDFDAFQQVANAYVYVDEKGITYGKQLLSSVLFFVPRSIWNDKSQPTGRVLAESLGYSFYNLSAPIWSEFYVDFSFFGLLVFMYLYGRLVRIFDRSRYLAVPIFCFSIHMYLLRGSLMTSISFAMVFLVLYYFCEFLLKRYRIKF
jgi:hypothetical protein